MAISNIGKLLSIRIFPNPIFVVGSGRSGTSILLQALGKHSRVVSAPGEVPSLTSIGGFVDLFEGDDKNRRVFYRQSLKINKCYLYRMLRRASFELAFGEYYGVFYFLNEIVKNPKKYWLKRRWAAKTFPPEHVTKALLCIFPKAKFLYIYRNGIDVIASTTKFKGFRNRAFEENCKRWSDAIFIYSYLQKYDAALALRHEELVRDPKGFFGKIFSFLGEVGDTNAYEFVSSTILHPLDQPTQIGVSVKDTLLGRKAAYLDWSEEQRKIFKEICTEAMIEAGYEIPF